MKISQRLREILHQPALRFALGALFALLFTWPFLSIASPLVTWLFLFVVWGLCIGVMALLSLGRPPASDDGEAGEADESERAH